MKYIKTIVVFGAAGKVGRLVVQYALADGYKVTAFVHRHHDLPSHESLSIVKGDVYNRADIERALKDADAVVSTLSSWGTQYKNVLSTAMSSITAVAKRNGIARVISLTGADARAHGDALTLLHRISHVAITVVGGKVLRDGEQHIKLLSNSKLQWTVIRSPIMTSKDSVEYVLSSRRPAPWALVSRSAVARAMVDQIKSDHNLRSAPFIR